MKLWAWNIIEFLFYISTERRRKGSFLSIFLIIFRADSTTFNILIDGTKCNNGIIYHLEHVVATFNLEYFKRGVLGAYITSPKGTRSKVIGHRAFDALAGYKRYENLTTLSVHYWGESSLGEWRLVFKNELPSQGTGPGKLHVIFSLVKQYYSKLLLKKLKMFTVFVHAYANLGYL